MFWTSDPKALVALRQFCTKSDHAYADRFSNEHDQAQRRACYGLLRFGLRKCAPYSEKYDIVREGSGRPSLSNSFDPSISLSHAHFGVAVMIGQNCMVGVDIEQDQAISVWEEITQVIPLGHAADPLAKLRYWTASEACAKSHGQGLPAIASTGVPYRPDQGDKPQWVTWNQNAPRDISTIRIPRGVLAYAVSAGTPVTVSELRESAIT
ncbi:MAG: hypothetical protein AAFQ09_09770 [Pseudomonadota bacterium]